MKALIINLARLGDLVQCTPVVRGLKRERGAEVHLLVTSNLAKFASRLDAVDEVLTFDDSDLSRGILTNDKSLSESYRAWKTLIKTIKNENYDLVVNLTHDIVSSRISHLCGAKEKLGRIEEPDGSVVVNGSWSRYFFSALQSRKTNPFNLVDIHLRSAGCRNYAGSVKCIVPEEGITEAEVLLSGLPSPIVAIHPGANHPNRRWPVTYFAQLADNLHHAGYTTALVGGPGDAVIADEVINNMESPALNLVGKTSLDGLLGVLSRVDLLITNDTGPLHVAASVQTGTVSIFLAFARPEDTSPYAPGHTIIETLFEDHPCPETSPCERPTCGFTVPVKAVQEVVLARLQDRPLNRNLMESIDGEFRILETDVNSDGFQTLSEVFTTGSVKVSANRTKTLREFWMNILGGTTLPRHFNQDNLPELPREAFLNAIELVSNIGNILEQSSYTNLPIAQILLDFEERMGRLEHSAGSWQGLFIAFRLEREAMYKRGRDTLLKEAPTRFAKWEEGMKVLSGDVTKEEVAA